MDILDYLDYMADDVPIVRELFNQMVYENGYGESKRHLNFLDKLGVRGEKILKLLKECSNNDYQIFYLTLDLFTFNTFDPEIVQKNLALKEPLCFVPQNKIEKARGFYKHSYFDCRQKLYKFSKQVRKIMPQKIEEAYAKQFGTADEKQ